jgi:hypothetical protein
VGHPIAKYASLVMSGKTLADLNFTEVGRREGCNSHRMFRPPVSMED